MLKRPANRRVGRAIAWGAATILVAGALGAVRTGVHAQPAASVSHGKAVYEAHCIECHGRTGRGDGPAAAMLMPRPRDFTAGKYKLRSTETGSIPTVDAYFGAP